MNRMRALTGCLALAMAGGLGSFAAAADAPLDLVACTTVADPISRLECYDERMARAGHPLGKSKPVRSEELTSHLTGPAQPIQVKPARPPAGPIEMRPRDEFGLDPDVVRKKREAESGSGSAEPAEMTGVVKAVSKRAQGEYQIELENGQIWVETLRTGGQPPEKGESVTIKRGALGSFYLNRAAGTALRVKRIR